MILKISHGYTVKDDGDPLVEMANKAMHNFSVITTPGRFLVDMLPICTLSKSLCFVSVASRVLLVRYLPDWFPGSGFHRDAKRWRKMVSETADTPHEFVLEHLVCFLFEFVVLVS